MKRWWWLAILGGVMLGGCTNDQPTADQSAVPPPAPSPVDFTRLRQPDAQEVVLETRRGRIVFELFPNAAPNHVARIKDLVSRHYYDGLLFHRVIPDFMIQFGDPNTRRADRSMWGLGADDQTSLKAEFSALPHLVGTVSMARRGNDADSATTQFFIGVGKPSPNLDGTYTVFGQVTEGQAIAETISKVQRDAKDAPVSDERVTKAYLIPTPKKLLNGGPPAGSSPASSGSPAAASGSPAASSASPPSASGSPQSAAPASGSPP